MDDKNKPVALNERRARTAILIGVAVTRSKERAPKIQKEFGLPPKCHQPAGVVAAKAFGATADRVRSGRVTWTELSPTPDSSTAIYKELVGFD